MMDIRLIALDLDGTLLTSEKKISPRTKAALAAARKQGVKVVLTTGRPLKAMDFLLQELDLDGQAEEYAITFNGGLIQRNTGEILAEARFSYQEVAELYQLSRELNLPLDVIQEGTVFNLEGPIVSRYQSFNPSLDFQLISFADLEEQSFYNKCISAHDAAALDGAIQQIPAPFFEKYGIFKSRDQLLEWLPKEADKARGLEKLTALLGLSKDQVMAFGDEANDLSMVQWAGYGVAMGNAVPALKDVAWKVLEWTNDQDGVARAVEEYVLKEKQDGAI
ncbi:Cof-type HAD-IIB family hydrolase [Streptococcus danieliae]|uniref:Cof-type HAD-IIB family hydrolase n=1 Tax=Streptococcus danieliae TaxID=747656 RepID=UPI0021C9DF45|nr:Cof-type HAD-IIB family hydrolase [Streptococcus danieliae]MCU0082378.1 Cof-type HAD-IIB family hydrolase [Streptococcus danieliae]